MSERKPNLIDKTMALLHRVDARSAVNPPEPTGTPDELSYENTNPRTGRRALLPIEEPRPQSDESPQPISMQIPRRTILIAGVVSVGGLFGVIKAVDGGRSSTPQAENPHPMGNPTDTASPSTPPALASEIAADEARLREEAASISSAAVATENDPCKDAPEFMYDSRFSEKYNEKRLLKMRKEAAARGVPLECLPKWGALEGSNEEEGYDMRKRIARKYPDDPVYGTAGPSHDAAMEWDERRDRLHPRNPLDWLIRKMDN